MLRDRAAASAHSLTHLAQFYRNGTKPLIAWAVVSFDRYTDQIGMERYVNFLCKTLKQHGVHVGNLRPECIGPINPKASEDSIKIALQRAAQSAYRAGRMSPQLICCVLPGK